MRTTERENLAVAEAADSPSAAAALLGCLKRRSAGMTMTRTTELIGAG